MSSQTFVFDACVFIDLSMNGVECLEFLLNKLTNATIFISDVNFQEIHDTYIREIINKSTNCKVIDVSNEELTNFWDYLDKNKMQMSKKDAAVLYLANNTNSDFVVSSDWNVVDKTNLFRKMSVEKKLIKPLYTIKFLELMVRQHIILPISHLKKGLLLFERKEFDNTCNHLIKKCNGCQERDRNLVIEENMDNIKNLFKTYRQSIIGTIILDSQREV